MIQQGRRNCQIATHRNPKKRAASHLLDFKCFPAVLRFLEGRELFAHFCAAFPANSKKSRVLISAGNFATDGTFLSYPLLHQTSKSEPADGKLVET
jgi:hypothetical protein